MAIYENAQWIVEGVVAKIDELAPRPRREGHIRSESPPELSQQCWKDDDIRRIGASTAGVKDFSPRKARAALAINTNGTDMSAAKGLFPAIANM